MNECLAIARETGHRDSEVNALNALGLLFARQRHIDRAEATLRQALTLAESFDGTFATAHVLANTTRLHLESGDLVRAEEDSVLALELLGDTESAETKAELHNLRGATARIHDRLDEAEQLHRTALAVAASAEHCYEHACALDGLGRVAAMRGDHAAAREHFTQAWRLFHRMGAPRPAKSCSDKMCLKRLLRRLGVRRTRSRGHAVRARMRSHVSTRRRTARAANRRSLQARAVTGGSSRGETAPRGARCSRTTRKPGTTASTRRTTSHENSTRCCLRPKC